MNINTQRAEEKARKEQSSLHQRLKDFKKHVEELEVEMDIRKAK